jgi:hypothetical protein
MFGHNERLARKLKEKGGVRASATVLESEKEWASTGGVNVSSGQAGSMTIHQKLRLRVEPDGEPPFETTVKQVFNDSYGWQVPREGYSVGVIYDPGDHSKLVIDMDAMPVAPGVDRDEAIARHERAMARMNDMMAESSPQIPATSPPPDVADELTKLADLRDRGVLTDAEFEAQKAKILSAS